MTLGPILAHKPGVGYPCSRLLLYYLYRNVYCDAFDDSFQTISFMYYVFTNEAPLRWPSSLKPRPVQAVRPTPVLSPTSSVSLFNSKKVMKRSRQQGVSARTVSAHCLSAILALEIVVFQGLFGQRDRERGWEKGRRGRHVKHRENTHIFTRGLFLWRLTARDIIWELLHVEVSTAGAGAI